MHNIFIIWYVYIQVITDSLLYRFMQSLNNVSCVELYELYFEYIVVNIAWLLQKIHRF